MSDHDDSMTDNPLTTEQLIDESKDAGTYVPRFGPAVMSPEDMISHCILFGTVEQKQIAAIADELQEAVRELQYRLDAAGIEYSPYLPLKWA